MAPGLVTPEKAELGKLPTDVWWHTIVSPTGQREDRLPDAEARGDPAPHRAGVDARGRLGARLLRRQRHDRRGRRRRSARRFVLVDENPEAIAVMKRAVHGIAGVEFEDGVRAAG